MTAWGRADLIRNFIELTVRRNRRRSTLHPEQVQQAPAANSFGIPTGFSKRTPLLALGLIVVTVTSGMAALLTPLLTNPETVLSPRKTLALIAARAAEQEAATAIKAAAPADVPAAFIKHLAAAVEQTHAAPTAAEAVQPPVEPKAEVANIASEASDAASEFPFTGVWAANQKACTPQLNREGYLPTIINEQGAWAGETTCAFKSARQEGDAVIVTAACSDPHKRWRSQVRLSVAAGRLIWKSQSGTRAYVRCEQGQERTRVAEVRSASR